MPEEVDLSSCDREPILTPSAIQPHGALLAVRSADLAVVHASANAQQLLHFTAGQILGKPLPDLGSEELLTAIAAVGVEERAGYTRRLTLTRRRANPGAFHVVLHRVGQLVVLEIEPAQGVPCWDQFSIRMGTAMENLQMARTLRELSVAAAREIRSLTGFDAIRIYRFHSDDHGEVIAEDRDDRMPSFLNLHFPASDIPPQARALYLRQRSRYLPDARYAPVPVLGHAELSQGLPLDMQFCALRSVSPMHLRYTRNMGIAGSFSISLVHEQRLWGLIIGHHRTPRLMPFETRCICDLLGQMTSSLIQVVLHNEFAAEQALNLERLDRLAKRMPPGTSMADVLAESAADLLDGAGASGAIVRLQGRTKLAGITPPIAESMSLLNAFHQTMKNGLAASSCLGDTLPEFGRFSPAVSGAMMVAVGNSIDDCVLWLRSEIQPPIFWGGNPDQAKTLNEATGDALPRESFEPWRSRRGGHSHPWREIDLAMARDFERMLTITMLRHADRRAQLGNVDTLTKLPNRRVLLERLARIQKEASPLPSALIFLDIDRFKIVNDTLGHAAGDDLLIQVASRLEACAGAEHLAVRMGGDEFVVFCENTATSEAELVAKRIVESFQQPFRLNDKPFRCSTSVGVAPMGGNMVVSVGDILHSADSAMYAAKRLGGNRFVLFEKPLREKLMREVQLEQDLFLAVERSEMKVYFQPQISVDRHHLIGFEALLRWFHPTYGSISPAEFIPMAERSGHIEPIGIWVLRESLRLIAGWRRRYKRELFVAVNVSGIQLAAEDFAERVREALEETNMPVEALHLEVTESLLIQPSAESQLCAIQALGVKIAIDDFGTGYSSLAYLQRLSVSELKLDSTFLADVGRDERKTTLFGSIVHMAHTLQLAVVAEGVEEAAQLQCIRECSCDSAQGYLFSKAICADSVEEMLSRGFQGDLPPLSAVAPRRVQPACRPA